MKSKILLSLALLILLLASCNKDDGMPAPNLTGTSWRSPIYNKTTPTLVIYFYADGTGTILKGPFAYSSIYSMNWVLTRLDEGVYNVHINYQRAGQDVAEDGTFKMEGKAPDKIYKLYMDNYICILD